MEKKRFIVTAGGTGGHIFPAIAIAEELISRGQEVLFVGNKVSMERKLVTEYGISFAPIDVQKLYRSFTWKHISFPFKFLKSYFMSNSIIKEFEPDICIGTGGFVSGPFILRAVLKRIPIYLQEQNSSAGLTTRLLSKYAQAIFVGFQEASLNLPGKKCIYTGNPLRNSIINRSTCSKNGRISYCDSNSYSTNKVANKKNEIFGENDEISILILGGSQGAKIINDTFLKTIPDLFSMSGGYRFRILWQCGAKNYTEVKNKLLTIQAKTNLFEINLDEKPADASPRKLVNCWNSIHIFPFKKNIKDVYEGIDLAITRAGAISLAELESMKIPAIIVPISKSAGNHQYLNAKIQETKGKAIMLEQRYFNKQSLLDTILTTLDNLDCMSNRFSESIHDKAAKEIVNHILMHNHTR